MKGSFYTLAQLCPWLLFLVLPAFVSSQDFVCSKSNVPDDVDFTVSLILKQNFGSSCNQVLSSSSEIIANFSNIITTIGSKKIGLKIFDSCSDPNLVTKIISDGISATSLSGQLGTQNTVCTIAPNASSASSASQVIITELGPSIGLNSLLGVAGTPLIDVSLGRPLLNPSPNTSNVLVKQIADKLANLCVKLNWDYVTVVTSDDEFGREIFAIWQNVSQMHHICSKETIVGTLKDKDAVIVQLKNLVTSDHAGVLYIGSDGLGYSLLPLIGEIGKPTAWVTNLDLKDLATYVPSQAEVYGIGKDQLPHQTIYTVLEALANSHQGEDNSAVQQFSERLEELKKLPPPVFSIQQVKNSTLKSMQDVDPQVTSQRSSLCTDEDCMSQCRSWLNNQDYIFIPGTYVILITVPITKSGASVWECREDSEAGRLLRTEAVMYAYKLLNDSMYGALVINSCHNRIQTQKNINDILSGKKEISWNGVKLDPKTVVAAIGDYSSSVAIQMQTLLRAFPFVQIGYGASSAELSDRKDFEFFLRTNPPDDLQASHMISIVGALVDQGNHDINALFLLYSTGAYGTGGAEKIKEIIEADERLCLPAGFTHELTNAINYDDIVGQMLQSTVNIIILFADPEHVDLLFEAIGKRENEWRRSGKIFVFSDTWNTDEDLLRKYGRLARGGLTFKFATGFKTKLAEHIKEVIQNPLSTDQNPWRSRLAAIAQGCSAKYIRGNFYRDQCSKDIDWNKYSTETYAVHLMKSIAAAIRGLDVFLEEESCSHQSNCNVAYEYSSTNKKHFNMKKVSLPLDLESVGASSQSKQRVFDEEGNGNVGYEVYNIVEDGDQLSYQSIINIQPGKDADILFDRSLTIYGETNKLKIVSKHEYCKVSVPEETTTPAAEADASWITPVIVVIAILLVCGTVIVVVYFFLKHKKNQYRQESSSQSPATTPNYGNSDVYGMTPDRLMNWHQGSEGSVIYDNPAFMRGAFGSEGSGESGCADNRKSSDYMTPTSEYSFGSKPEPKPRMGRQDSTPSRANTPVAPETVRTEMTIHEEDKTSINVDEEDTEKF